MLVTDTSGSMNATDVAPDRLTAAKAAATRFLDRVPDQLQTGLVAFADGPHTVLRPTQDRAQVSSTLEALQRRGRHRHRRRARQRADRARHAREEQPAGRDRAALRRRVQDRPRPGRGRAARPAPRTSRSTPSRSAPPTASSRPAARSCPSRPTPRRWPRSPRSPAAARSPPRTPTRSTRSTRRSARGSAPRRRSARSAPASPPPACCCSAARRSRRCAGAGDCRSQLHGHGELLRVADDPIEGGADALLHLQPAGATRAPTAEPCRRAAPRHSTSRGAEREARTRPSRPTSSKSPSSRRAASSANRKIGAPGGRSGGGWRRPRRSRPAARRGSATVREVPHRQATRPPGRSTGRTRPQPARAAEMEQQEARDDGVEGPVFERQRLGVAMHEHRPPGAVQRASASIPSATSTPITVAPRRPAAAAMCPGPVATSRTARSAAHPRRIEQRRGQPPRDRDEEVLVAADLPFPARGLERVEGVGVAASSTPAYASAPCPLESGSAVWSSRRRRGPGCWPPPSSCMPSAAWPR